jgi:hypothetical protein
LLELEIYVDLRLDFYGLAQVEGRTVAPFLNGVDCGRHQLEEARKFAFDS